jgi:hypothetical protein
LQTLLRRQGVQAVMEAGRLLGLPDATGNAWNEIPAFLLSLMSESAGGVQTAAALALGDLAINCMTILA